MSVRDLFRLLNDPNLTSLRIRAGVLGQVSLDFADPSGSGTVQLVIKPQVPSYELLEYAPLSWIRTSQSLQTAVRNKWIALVSGAVAEEQPAVVVAEAPPSGTISISVADEGSQVDGRTSTINFVGSGVDATSDGNGNVTVTIPGGSGGVSGIDVIIMEVSGGGGNA